MTRETALEYLLSNAGIAIAALFILLAGGWIAAKRGRKC